MTGAHPFVKLQVWEDCGLWSYLVTTGPDLNRDSYMIAQGYGFTTREAAETRGQVYLKRRQQVLEMEA